MCYRCKVCGDAVPHGHAQMRWSVYKGTVTTRINPSYGLVLGVHRDIATEMPVCQRCHADLDQGSKLDHMTRKYAAQRERNRRRRPGEFGTSKPRTRTGLVTAVPIPDPIVQPKLVKLSGIKIAPRGGLANRVILPKE